MNKRKDKIVLFKPHLSKAAKDAARRTLDSRWIGQGPLVDAFELFWQERISHKNTAVAVNSGTSALHLAYILAGIGPGDEVIVPVFSCSATMTPLLYLGAKPIFADIQEDTLNIDPMSITSLVTSKTKAIVAVHYGGMPADLGSIRSIAKDYGLPVIEDAAQAHGATYLDQNIGEISEFTAFSFQAIKTITTGDGGMLAVKDPILAEKAKRIRWFGIDRQAKFEDRWKKDIMEVGYKYQMTDIAAAMGIVGLSELDETLKIYDQLHERYKKHLDKLNIEFVRDKLDQRSSHWLMTVFVDKRDELKRKLLEYNVESDPTHYRCDQYSIFGGRTSYCHNMDNIEDKYLILPCYPDMSLEDVDYICEVLRSGW